MLSKNKFNAMLVKVGMTKQELADKLGMDRANLYRRISKDLDFDREEILKLIDIFGEEEVIDALFHC